MRYRLTTTREGRGCYQHVIQVTGPSVERVQVWHEREHKGVVAGIVNDYIRLNIKELRRTRSLESVTHIFKFK